MTTSRKVEYFFLRYVPNVLRDEGVAIAVVVIDPTDLRNGICAFSLAGDWQNQVRLIDEYSDLDMLGALLTEIRNRLLSKHERSHVITQMEDSFSNVVQISERRKSPIALNSETIDAFARELLQKPPKMSPGTACTGRKMPSTGLSGYVSPR